MSVKIKKKQYHGRQERKVTKAANTRLNFSFCSFLERSRHRMNSRDSIYPNTADEANEVLRNTRPVSFFPYLPRFAVEISRALDLDAQGFRRFRYRIV